MTMRKSPKILFITIGLAIVTIAVYWQVQEFNFINFDDNLYVRNNQHVIHGFSFKNLIWAFNPDTTDRAYWHPLTWISHMTDVEFFGLNAGAHHIVNLFFHIANSLLLFLVLHLMTGAIWKSAFVAAVFALHPVNVDSVAWIAERKNLLSTFFWMLTMLAYIYYSRKPDILRYFLVFFTLALGLLAKSMLVTLPCVLLLIDFWPLGRMALGQKGLPTQPRIDLMFQTNSLSRLIVEKIPLLGLSFTTIYLSAFSLQVNNQLISQTSIPMTLRIENAIVSYVVYLWKLIWPVHLAVFYPFPKFIPFWQPFGAALFLIAVSALIFAKARKSPWLATGWLWYLGTLVPVIGLVQGGLWPALADRWAYVPFIGVFIMIAWGVAESIPHFRLKQAGLTVSAAVLLCALSAVTWIQAGHWKNSQTLFEHALRVNPNNFIAHKTIGDVEHSMGNNKEAIYHYQKAIQIEPNYEEAYNNLGTVLLSLDHYDAAISRFKKAIQVNSRYIEAHFNLGTALLQKGQVDEAINSFFNALAMDPEFIEARINLANALMQQGKITEAVRNFQIILEKHPDNVEANMNMGAAMARLGQINAALACYQTALKSDPYNPEAHNNMGVLLVQKNMLAEARAHFQNALSLRPGYESAINNLRRLDEIQQ